MEGFDGVDALSFDCYGTLIDWETGIATELRAWADRLGVAASDDELLAVFAGIESTVQDEQPTALYPDVLAETLRRIGSRHGVDVSDDAAAEFGASVGRWPAFPDSAESLARLKERYRLIILSNVDRRSFAASNERLRVEFDLIVTAQDVGAYKPSPKSFPALLDRIGTIGVTRDRLVHVAQSLFHDHVPAKREGLTTVWIDRRAARGGTGATPTPAEAVEPDWRFGSLAEFADAVLVADRS